MGRMGWGAALRAPTTAKGRGRRTARHVTDVPSTSPTPTPTGGPNPESVGLVDGDSVGLGLTGCQRFRPEHRYVRLSCDRLTLSEGAGQELEGRGSAPPLTASAGMKGSKPLFTAEDQRKFRTALNCGRGALPRTRSEGGGGRGSRPVLPPKGSASLRVGGRCGRSAAPRPPAGRGPAAGQAARPAAQLRAVSSALARGAPRSGRAPGTGPGSPGDVRSGGRTTPSA